MNYIGTCKDRNNNDIRVVISTSTSGADRTINIVSDGIEINYDADSIFKPIKKSGASIEILTEYIIDDFYTGSLLDPTVSIYKNNALIWFGYISPTVFTQPFVNQKETLTLECIDTLANLEYVDYTYINSALSVQTLITIIKHILDKTDPNKNIKSIFCTKSISVNSTTDILSELAVLERNFSDEIEDIMKCDEVIEEICKFLGVCMFQYKDAYYIVDYANMNADYTRYDRGQTQTSNVLSSTPINISTIGVGAADANISLDGVYNKIKVIANTLKSSNPIESDDTENSNTSTDLFRDIVQNSTTTPYETIDIWVNPDAPTDESTSSLQAYDIGVTTLTPRTGVITTQYRRKNHIWDTVSHDGWKHYKLLCSFWKLGSQWNIQHDGITYVSGTDYVTGQTASTNRQLDLYNGTLDFNKVTDVIGVGAGYPMGNRWGVADRVNMTINIDSGQLNDGVVVEKTFAYDADEVPAEIKWNTALTIPLGGGHHNWISDYFLKTTRAYQPVRGGGFVVNIEWYFSWNNNIAETNIFKEYQYKYKDTDNRNVIFPATLAVGNNYWDGDAWQTYPENYLAKKNDGYFDSNVVWSNQYVYSTREPYYWRIWNDSWNDWQYVTKSVYNSFSGTKEQVDMGVSYIDDWGNYHLNNTGHCVCYPTSGGEFFAPKEYWDEYVLDRFPLVKQFKVDDKKYGNKVKLTNTLSFTDNAVDTDEGVFIPIPDDLTLTGNITFGLCKPISKIENVSTNPFNAGAYLTSGYGIYGCVLHMTNCYVNYTAVDKEQNVYAKSKSNNDITYENTINNDYVESYDDVQLKINTYNPTISSYSYLYDKNMNFVDNVYYNHASKKQELHLIDKYTNHFSTPKFKYSGTLHDVNITPCSIVHQTQLNTNLAVYKTTYHLLNNTVEIESVEV